MFACSSNISPVWDERAMVSALKMRFFFYFFFFLLFPFYGYILYLLPFLCKDRVTQVSHCVIVVYESLLQWSPFCVHDNFIISIYFFKLFFLFCIL